MSALAILSQTLLLLALAPLLSGCIRNWKAKLQNRRGPRVWQPYLDLAKFLRKDMVISEHASWIFRAMPYVLFISTLLAGLMVPLVSVSAPLSLFGGALAFVGLLALGRFFLALGGLDPASAFGGMGSSREMTIAAVAEPALMLAIFTVAITAGSTNLSQMLLAAQGPTWKLLNPAHVLAFAALFIVLLAETGRIPVDNPATHLELTMIHEAMILEYSGRYLALIEWSASVKQLVLMALLVNIFFPVGIATDLSAGRPGAVAALVRRQAARAGRRGGAGRDHQRQAAPVPRAGPAERRLHPGHAGAAFDVPVSNDMNPLQSELASQWITLLAAGMLVIQLLMVVQGMLLTNIRLFALQSLLLAAIAAIVAYFHNATARLLGRRADPRRQSVLSAVAAEPAGAPHPDSPGNRAAAQLAPPPCCCAADSRCWATSSRGPSPRSERLGNNTLGIAITLLLTGFFLMFNRRKAITQVLALLTVENGVMLAAVALTTYGMPLVVELGIFFDVLVAVMVLGLLVYRIRETFASMDVSKLSQLKG